MDLVPHTRSLTALLERCSRSELDIERLETAATQHALLRDAVSHFSHQMETGEQGGAPCLILLQPLLPHPVVVWQEMDRKLMEVTPSEQPWTTTPSVHLLRSVLAESNAGGRAHYDLFVDAQSRSPVLSAFVAGGFSSGFQPSCVAVQATARDGQCLFTCLSLAFGLENHKLRNLASAQAKKLTHELMTEHMLPIWLTAFQDLERSTLLEDRLPSFVLETSAQVPPVSSAVLGWAPLSSGWRGQVMTRAILLKIFEKPPWLPTDGTLRWDHEYDNHPPLWLRYLLFLAILCNVSPAASGHHTLGFRTTRG